MSTAKKTWEVSQIQSSEGGVMVGKPVERYGKRAQHVAEAVLFRAVLGVCSLLSIKTTRRICGSLGAIIGSLRIKPVKTAVSNLELALGDRYTPAQRREIVRENFRHLGWTVADVLKCKALQVEPDRYFTIHNTHHYYEAKKKYGATILMAFHYASFEWVAQYIGLMMGPISLLVKDQANPHIDRWIKTVRRDARITNIAPSRSLPQIKQALCDGSDVVFTFDQHAKKRSAIYVPFFGRTAATGKRLAELALEFDIPVVGSAAWWTKDGRLEGGYYAPIPIKKTGDKKRDIAEYTVALNQFIADRITEHPMDWIWPHHRWRPVPPDVKVAIS